MWWYCRPYIKVETIIYSKYRVSQTLLQDPHHIFGCYFIVTNPMFEKFHGYSLDSKICTYSFYMSQTSLSSQTKYIMDEYLFTLNIFLKRNMLPWAHHEWSPIRFSRPQVYRSSQFCHLINFKLRSRDQIFSYADPVENSLYNLPPLKMVLPFLWWRNMEFLKIIRFTQRVLYHYLKFLLVPRILCKLVVTK